MAMIGTLLMFLGWLIALIGGIMVLIKAFQQSVWWGLGSIFIPFVSLIFVIMYWSVAKKGFLISLGGTVLAIVGVFVAAAGGHTHISTN